MISLNGMKSKWSRKVELFHGQFRPFGLPAKTIMFGSWKNSLMYYMLTRNQETKRDDDDNNITTILCLCQSAAVNYQLLC
jgi:hypothetical protein